MHVWSVFQEITMRFVTVREKEEALIFNVQGEGRLVVGPQRVKDHYAHIEAIKNIIN